MSAQETADDAGTAVDAGTATGAAGTGTTGRGSTGTGADAVAPTVRIERPQRPQPAPRSSASSAPSAASAPSVSSVGPARAGSPAGTAASDRALVPRIRLGRCWLNLTYTIPAAAVLLGLLVVAAVLVRHIPGVQDFVAAHPGYTPPADPAAEGFPAWLRWQHAINVLFLLPIMRAGLQILVQRPRLYWRSPGVPGTEWLRMRPRVDPGRRFSPRDDPASLPAAIGLPGPRRSAGVARAWHLGLDLLWVANGILFYVLLFSTGQWQRIVPTHLAVFPDALSTALQYLSLDFPASNSWVAYNGLQLLTYFVTVFVAAPLAVVTGLLQSPVISRRVRAAGSRWANVEVARSVHVLVLGWFTVFVVVHVTLVLITGAARNLNHITVGGDGVGPAGLVLFGVGVLVLAGIWVALSPLTARRPQAVQSASRSILGPLARLF